MPTDSHELILNRELSKVEGREVLEVALPLLTELVNHATHALVRCLTDPSLEIRKDENVATFALYRHIIEMTDGIEVLLSQCCTTAAIALLRSSFEARLQLEYILENEAEYIRRSLAWMVGYVHERIDACERLDPSTKKGGDTKVLFDRDRFVKPAVVCPDLPKKSQATVKGYLNMLAKPHLQPIEAEYVKYRRPAWYQLFGGPDSLRSLADRLHHGGQYVMFYKEWSATVHGQDFRQFADKTDRGEPSIKRMRSPEQIKLFGSFAANFLFHATIMMLKKFRPGEDLAVWYRRELQQRYQWVCGLRAHDGL